MSYLSDNFPRFDCDETGIVYKDGKILKPFHSNGYLQVILVDTHRVEKTCGVHTVVAMKFLNYFDGCVVHHKDGTRQNNAVSNLEVYSRNEHSRLHGLTHDELKTHNLGKPAWNKGIKMSAEFCQHCKDSAIKRWHPDQGN